MTEQIQKLIANVEAVSALLPSIIVDSIIANKEEIIDLNVGQLREGLRSDGRLIEPDYESDDYAQFKKSIGSKAPKGTPDLILEGDFTGRLDLTKAGDRVLFDSDNPKTPRLESKYDNIFGLTKENKAAALAISENEIINTIENEIFK